MTSRAVLLVHDVVNDFIEPADTAQAAVLENVARLLGAARAAAVPVVFVGPGKGDPAIPPSATPSAREVLVWGSPGVDVPATLGPWPGEALIRKPRWGAFHGSALTEYLRNLGCDTIIVCGFSLGGGITITVRDAFNRDLKAVVVADACFCRAIPDQGWGAIASDQVEKVVLSVLAQRFARVTSTTQICRALSSLAGDLNIGLIDKAVIEKP